jgi:hypothetical protein
MLDKELAPIVLFVYNRLDHSIKTIEALEKNILAAESELFIYSDAPKDESEIQNVLKVRWYIKKIQGFKKVTIFEAEKNLGLAKSIINGVSTIVNKYGKIIVLEDDLVTSPYFLKFMNDALNVYKNEKNIWEIGGYVYPIKVDPDIQTYLLPVTTSWGWATWKDRWQYFSRDPDNLVRNFSDYDIELFNVDNSVDIWSQVVLNNKGAIHTWAVFWYANVFLNKGMVLYPYQSIVNNIGHDGSGENCGKSSQFDNELLDHKIKLKKLSKIEINQTQFKRLKVFFKKNKDNFFIAWLKLLYWNLFK